MTLQTSINSEIFSQSLMTTNKKHTGKTSKGKRTDSPATITETLQGGRNRKNLTTRSLPEWVYPILTLEYTHLSKNEMFSRVNSLRQTHSGSTRKWFYSILILGLRRKILVSHTWTHVLELKQSWSKGSTGDLSTPTSIPTPIYLPIIRRFPKH